MAEFSSALRLTDLDDFLGPSQACVLPDLNGTPQPQNAQLPGESAEKPTASVALADCLACSGCVTSAETVLVTAQSVDEFLRMAPRREGEGGGEREGDSAAAAPSSLVVTLAPQAAAALGVHFQRPASDVYTVLGAALTRAGFRGFPLASSAAGGRDDDGWEPVRVLDSNLGRVFSLVETAAELRSRLRQAGRRVGRGGSPADSSSAEAAPAANNNGNSSNASSDADAPPPAPLPMLSSACPGFVCYAEKKYGSEVIPHISTVRSPQQIMGSLVKRVAAPRRGIAPESVYHVAIMPCFDKKLEAARDDFYVPGTNDTREVDCVLSSAELLDLFERLGRSLTDADIVTGRDADIAAAEQPSALAWLAGRTDQQSSNKESPKDVASAPEPDSDAGRPGAALVRAQSAGSGGAGGYLDFVFRDLHFRHGVAPPDRVEFAPARRGNADLRAVALAFGGDDEEEEHQHQFRLERAYGFRNIANSINKVRKKSGVTAMRAPPDFVEVMACPSGCTNGGGQVRVGSPEDASRESPSQSVTESRESARQRLQRVNATYNEDSSSVCRALGLPGDASEDELTRATNAAYESLVGDAPMSAAARDLLHTRYHDRSSAEIGINPLSVKW
jgi:cytosolic iron-sulfur assembly component 3